MFGVAMNIHQIPYDLNWIIDLVKQQEPARHDIVNGLIECKNGYWESKAYLRFVDGKDANQPGAEWQIDDCIVLEHETEGDIVIDLLKDGRIGGIEFVSRIEQ